MSNQINNGGPAFPTDSEHTRGPGVKHFSGMTLRDWFAGQALVMLPHHGCGADLNTEDTAIAAYQVADAMIAARSKSE